MPSAASFLITPLELKFWSDPYVEGEDRTRTDLNFPGLRLRWTRILETGLEVTFGFRQYRFGEEKSGLWLTQQGRLDIANRALLDRNGDVYRLQARYRINVDRHRIEPGFTFVNDVHRGGALANVGYGVQLTYLYLSPRFVFDVQGFFGTRQADEVHPVYGQTLDLDRRGIAMAAIIPVKRMKSSTWSLLFGGEIMREDANIDFFKSSVQWLNVGVVWRHRKQ